MKNLANLVVCSIMLVLSGAAYAESQVNVLLQEWRLVTDVSTVKAGPVTLSIQNRGREPHEFVLMRTDQPYNRLPLKSAGGIDEDKAGSVISEVEDIGPKDKRIMKVNLAPGTYALICNMVEMEEGQLEQHYSMGMHASLVVK
ncbi:MAG: cupredoxin domain-containing protein [Gammaproteobacteria bacterium]|nr:cupredoxin domain-containing protein [Gammaproteobacteria bacterium]MDH5729671.1 cupredoxin domain-containing protein [Gammaproteobacteria bacterium]